LAVRGGRRGGGRRRCGELRDELHKPALADASGCGGTTPLGFRQLLPITALDIQLPEKAHMSYYCSECVNWSPDQSDRAQCPTCGADTVDGQGPAGDGAQASPLELVETAHMAARLCWLWPDDHEQRMAAVQACQAIDLDYIEAVAKVMQATAASAHVARRELAEALRSAADRIYAADGRAGDGR
jgi:hypothetical protein